MLAERGCISLVVLVCCCSSFKQTSAYRFRKGKEEGEGFIEMGNPCIAIGPWVTAELSISFISALFCPHVSSSSLPDSNGVIIRVGRIRCASHSQEMRWIFPPSRYGWEKNMFLDVYATPLPLLDY